MTTTTELDTGPLDKPGLPDRREDDQLRKARIMELRRIGTSFEAIGKELGISRQRVHQIHQEALAEIPVPAVAAYRQEQLERLDMLLERASEVLARQHLIVQGGKVVTTTREREDGTIEEIPYLDDGPTLEAVRTILQVEKLRAELLGTPAPVRVEAAAVVRYEIIGVDLSALK